MKRIIASILVIAAILAAVSFSLFIFIGLMLLGVVAYMFFFARQFLVNKGILNPTLGVPPEGDEAPAQITIIDGDYERVPEETK